MGLVFHFEAGRERELKFSAPVLCSSSGSMVFDGGSAQLTAPFEPFLPYIFSSGIPIMQSLPPPS